jgi:chitinase
MPAGTTISVTAPASFWYLQSFMIEDMATLVDYVVFMTYDLHGQWDYGNAFSDPGCPGGNCLRSDVNLTETISALSMITKAGVPANQIVVGVTSYGRSFQMTTAGCYTEMCTYTGPNSGAYAGLCTQTPGYISNAEINGIIDGNGTVTSADGSVVDITGTPLTYLDTNSYSNIVVYDDTQWVGYMDDSNKATREALYQTYNFGGTADWAIDLQSYTGDGGNGTSSSIVSVSPSIWTSGNPSIPCEPPCIIVLPPYPLGFTETITWPTLTTTLLASSAGSIYTVTTTISVPEFTITALSLQPITLGPTDTATYVLDPVQSVTPTSFIFTLGPNEATFPPTAIPTDGESTRGPATSTSTGSTGAAILPGVTFHTTPFPVTIQPQPTYSITLPPLPTPIPPVTISTGTPQPPCSGSGCGSRDCGIFGCTPGCGLFGCDGGCSIFGCGGGCGPLGCVGSCPLDVCGGLDCIVPGSCGGSEGGGDGDDGDDDCDEPVTVSACTYIVSSYSTAPMTEYSTTTTVRNSCPALFVRH